MLNCFSIEGHPEYWFENVQVLSFDRSMFQLQERYEDSQRLYFIGYFMVDAHGRSQQLDGFTPAQCKLACERLSDLPPPT